MKKKHLLLFLFISLFNLSKAEVVQLSVYSEVSFITAGPGKELFEAFGHSAIRIKDPILQLDIVYNYGMFDFNAPNFYMNFVKGKLLYNLGKQRFDRFLYSYNYQKRCVKQQVLNLNQQEKQAFFLFLENNAIPENRQYLYDPYYNNCATKLRDISTTILGKKISFNPLNSSQKEVSLRDLMAAKIPWNTWGSFGINLALGNKLDKIATEEQYMYLPDYVFSKFKNATIDKNGNLKNLVKREDILTKHKERKYAVGILNPLLVFTVISVFGIFITYKDVKRKKRTKWLDFLSFFVTGFVGIIILFLWFFTDHSTTPNNFNFLWAFAPNLFFAIMLLKKIKKSWIVTYVKILILFLIVIPFVWMFKIQELPIAIIPFLVFLLVRYIYLQKNLLPSVK